MGKTVACIVTRTLSTRLPLKGLRTVTGEYSMLDYIIRRVKKVEAIDEIYICTTTLPSDDILEDVAGKHGIKIYRGSPDQVIERLIAVADLSGADNLVRITGDNVFTSYEYLQQQINLMEEHHLDYIRINDLPLGATADVMAAAALKDCYNRIDLSVSEYIMLYIYDPERYKCGVMKVLGKDYSSYTLTVDTPEDLARTRAILKALPEDRRMDALLTELIEVIEQHDIPHVTIQQADQIKMPYDRLITYEAFKQDMKKREEQSEQFLLID